MATRPASSSHRRERSVVAIIVSASALALVAFASSSLASSPSSGVARATAALKQYLTAPTKINLTTPLKSPAPTGKYLIFLGTSQVQNVQGQVAEAQAAKALHWKYSEISYDAANPATFISALNLAIAKRPNFITEAGTPASAINASQLAQMKADHIKFDTTASYPTEINSTVIANTDTYANLVLWGKIIGYYFVSHSNGTGNALVVHVPAYAVLDGFTNGFGSVVRTLCPKCTVQTVDISLPQLSAGQINSTVVNALKRDTSAHYLVYDDAPWADGIQSSLAASGISNIQIIGEAADASAIAALHNHTELAWTAFNTQYSYYEAVDAFIRSAEGMPVPASDALNPTQLLTSANIGSRTTWAVPNEFQQFVKLWKK